MSEAPFFAEPVVGWRTFSCYHWRVPGEEHVYTFLSSATRPDVIWSSDGDFPHAPSRQEKAQCAPGSNRYNWETHDYGPHPVPGERCNCGWAAYHTYEDLMLMYGFWDRGWDIAPYDPEMALASPARHKPTVSVVGLVQAWGDLVSFDTTFRSEYMRVAALLVVEGKTAAVARRHAHLLDVPALSLEEMREYAEYAGVCLKGFGGGS